MPRARNIKYSFFMDDKLAEENDPLGRILYIGLWTIADCNGNLEWRSKKVKAEILPYDNCDIEKLAINLDKSGFIRFYSDGDILYCHIPSFAEEQNPHKNERDAGSKVPLYSEDMRQAVDFKGLTINLDKSGLKRNLHRTDPADSCFLIPDSFILNPESRNPDSCRPADSCHPTHDDPLVNNPPVKNSPKKKDPDPYEDDIQKVFEHWRSVIADNDPAEKLNASRRKKIKARLKDKGSSIDQLIAAIDNCAATAWNTENRVNGINYIFKDRSNVRKFQNKPILFKQEKPIHNEKTSDRVRRELAEASEKDITPTDGE